MPNFNQCTVMGHLTAAPELKHIPSGTAVAEFAVAVHRYIKAGEEDVLFLPVTVWGKAGESCARNLQKGSCALITGFLKQENWQTPEGQKRSIIKLVAENVQFIGRNNGNAQLPQQQGNGASNHRQYGPPRQQNNQQYVAPQGGQHRYGPEDCPPPQAGGNSDFNDDIPF